MVNHWADFLGKSTISDFMQSTQIRVVYSESSSLEDLEAKLADGVSYDTITPSHVLAGSLLKQGALVKVDKAAIPNLKNIDPSVWKKLEHVDPGNDYLVPFSFTGIVIGINEALVRKTLGEEIPSNKIELLFNPTYAAKLKSCGISMLDYPTEAFSLALSYLGRNPLSTSPRHQEMAYHALQVLRPNVTQFSNDAYLMDLAEGRICVATGFSSDLLIAKSIGANQLPPIKISVTQIPDRSPGYFTVLAIPKSAQHPAQAMKWINHLLDAKQSATLTNDVNIATGNLAATPYLHADAKRDPLRTLSTETYRKFYLPEEIPFEIREQQKTLWGQLKHQAVPAK